MFSLRTPLSNIVWMAYISEGFAIFEEISQMNVERRKPYILCPQSETMYAIGGFGADGSQHRSCEKYIEGMNVWEPIDSLVLDPLNVFGLSHYIYVFERLGDNALFQRLCCDHDSYGWQQVSLKHGHDVDHSVEDLENFNISSTNSPELLIFGGTLPGGAKSEAMYILDSFSGSLINYKTSFVYPSILPQSYSDSKNHTYYITTNYQFLMYSKYRNTWCIQDTDIIEKIEKKGFGISI